MSLRDDPIEVQRRIDTHRARVEKLGYKWGPSIVASSFPEDPYKVGLTLLRRREQMGYKMRQAARFLGVGHSLIGLWETGRVIPSCEGVRKYAKWLGLDPRELVLKCHHGKQTTPPEVKELIELEIGAPDGHQKGTQ